MSMLSKIFSPPKPPDPQQGMALGQQLADTQQGYNTTSGKESQQGSMVSQSNPYGTLDYSQTGTNPDGTAKYTASVNLTPQQQSMFDVLQGTKAGAGTDASKIMQGANYGTTDPRAFIGDATSGTTKALMDKQMGYLQPFFDTEKSQLDATMRAQGLFPGQPAYDNSMRQLETNHGLVVSKAAADAEGTAFGQAKDLYSTPASMATALAGFGAPNDPNKDFVNTPGLNIQPANAISATQTENQSLDSNYKAQMDQYSAMMTGLTKLGSAALGGWATGGLSAIPGLLGSGSSGGDVHPE